MAQANDVERGKQPAWLLALIVLGALGLCAHVLVPAAENKPERDSQRIIIAYSSISGNMAALWSQNAGFSCPGQPQNARS